MSKVRRGMLFSLSERYVLIVLQLASAMVLARLLTPEEIGIYSVSLAVIGIAQVLRDFGVGSFLIQEKHLTDDIVRTAFGVSLLLGGVLFAILYSAAPLAGHFYADPRLVETMRISACNFLTLPFCTISLALLRRDMLFKRLAAVNIAAALINFSVGISLAYSGFGPNSMAAAAVAGNVATAVLAWLVRPDRALLLPSLTEWRRVFKFGSQSTTARIVTSISMDINDLALGKLLGFGPVAQISRAQGLMNLFHRDLMNAVRSVMYPAFAKAHRDDEAVDGLYVRTVGTVTAFAWPFYGFASLYAFELIRLMFGHQWVEASTLVPIFCLAGMFGATNNLLLPAVIAIGRIDLATRADLVIQPLRALAIVGAAVVFESLFACAVAFLVAFALVTPYLYRIKDRCMATDYASLRRELWASGKVTVITLLLPAILAVFAPAGDSVPEVALRLVPAAVLAAVSWVAGLFLFDHPLKTDPLLQRVLGWLRLAR